ncbi:hypothetical protein GGTG_02044 [Gaeumannomyces tritici R3-111a-1]|uniref:Uncharacterized protein n=1 Tax=Gaeumannomyces tritici (strain R3-111a-1) TaxID=644352 RepID=J3NL96_GAET3|nr:hypothetical protein GGTG_02044 [Gaeumannomyces tritici R3-111a-1]EJT82070.1 hypothetical protein GGTG_02044 [Gaeumannomyces tritici R3-111a-1]
MEEGGVDSTSEVSKGVCKDPVFGELNIKFRELAAEVHEEGKGGHSPAAKSRPISGFSTRTTPTHQPSSATRPADLYVDAASSALGHLAAPLGLAAGALRGGAEQPRYLNTGTRGAAIADRRASATWVT